MLLEALLPASTSLGGTPTQFFHFDRYDYSQYGAMTVTVGYDPNTVIYSDTADDVFVGPYNGSAQSYGQVEIYNAPRGFLKNELAGHYIGFTITGQLRYFKIVANASFTDSLYTNAIVVAEDLTALGVTDFSAFVVVPPFDAPKANPANIIYMDSAHDVYSEPGTSILEDQSAVGHAKHAMRGNFLEFTTGGFTYRVRIADNSSFDEGGGVFTNTYRLDHENLEILLASAQNFTIVGPKASYTLEWSLPRQTGTVEAFSGVPGYYQLDDYDGTIDWMDGELDGWEIEFDIHGVPTRFKLLSNFTKRTPDAEVMYNGYTVGEDLVALGVLEGARYKIYAPRQTILENDHGWGGGRRDREDITDNRYLYGFRHYSANMRGWISRDPIESDVLWNDYCGMGRNPGTMVDPTGLVNIANARDRDYDPSTEQGIKRARGSYDWQDTQKNRVSTPSIDVNSGEVNIFVHGYNVGDKEAIQNWGVDMEQALKAAGMPSDLTTFLWRGDVGKTRFNKAQLKADEHAVALVQLINDLQNKWAKKPESVRKGRELKINLLAHSLGNQVALEALKKGAKVNNLVMLQPAVDEDAVMQGGEYSDALKNAKRIAFTHSEKDKVVGHLYPLSELSQGLGRYDENVDGLQRVNLDSELSNMEGDDWQFSRAHSDIRNPRVTRAIASILGWDVKK